MVGWLDDDDDALTLLRRKTTAPEINPGNDPKRGNFARGGKERERERQGSMNFCSVYGHEKILSV